LLLSNLLLSNLLLSNLLLSNLLLSNPGPSAPIHEKFARRHQKDPPTFQVFPFVSGYVFKSEWGPNGILELTLIVCAVQCSLYASMWFLSRKKVPFTQFPFLRICKN
jgi:hypothetical protein